MGPVCDGIPISALLGPGWVGPGSGSAWVQVASGLGGLGPERRLHAVVPRGQRAAALADALEQLLNKGEEPPGPAGGRGQPVWRRLGQCVSQCRQNLCSMDYARVSIICRHS